MVRAEFPSVRYFRVNEDVGFGAGLARGMASYDREYDFIWLLEDDSRPRETALERCLSVASRTPRLGVIGLGGGRLEHRSPVEIFGWLVRQAKFCAATLLCGDQVFERIRLRLLGGWHALRGVRGKTI